MRVIEGGGKRAREPNIDETVIQGDSQPITAALQIVIPDSIDGFFDQMSDARFEVLAKGVTEAKQASKVMPLFVKEVRVMDPVEAWSFNNWEPLQINNQKQSQSDNLSES